MDEKTDDVLLIRARSFLRDRIRLALEVAQNDVCRFLRESNAANTDHAFDLSRFADALIYDVVKEKGRPQYTRSGSISCDQCPSFDEIARNLANHAAKAALEALGFPGSASGNSGEP